VLTDGTITTVAGNGFANDTGDGGPATSAGVAQPYGIAPTSDGGFLIADTVFVRKVAPDTCPGTTHPPPCKADLSVSGEVTVSGAVPGFHVYPTDTHGVFQIPDTNIGAYVDIVVRNDGPDSSQGGAAAFDWTGFSQASYATSSHLCIPPLEHAEKHCTIQSMRPGDLGVALFFFPENVVSYRGYKVVYFVDGTYSIAASVTGANDPTVPDNVTLSATVYPQEVAKQKQIPASEPASKLNSFEGKAAEPASKSRDAIGNASAASLRARGVARRVQIALLRLTPGARAPRTGNAPSCSWLASSSARFKTHAPTKGVCNKQVWLDATGTRHWRYKLRRRLPSGRYVLYSRVIDGVGNPTAVFSAALGDRQAFRLT
jgi:hypothetical protein